MSTRWMKVTVIGYVPLIESELAQAYEADSFEAAVANQEAWIEDDSASVIELVAEANFGGHTLELMPEDFHPDNVS